MLIFHIYTICPCLFSLIVGTRGHMQLSNPPPLRSKFNPYTGTDIDYSMTNPLRADGSDFPCKGYQALLTTVEGSPVTTLEGGDTYSMTVTGQAIHAGGSCQASLSVDGGKTFRVLHTYIGGCPMAMGDNKLTFRVPADVPTKDRALLGWTWFNNLGNREMYMNCASVNTKTGREGNGGFLSRPTIFKANVGNGCATVESKDVMIPNPGPEVTVNNPNAVPPVGTCETGPGPGSPDTSAKPDESEGSGSCPATSASNHRETTGPYSRGYAPGNDWPEGFKGTGSNGYTSTIAFVGVVNLLVFVIGVWLWA
ncbi:hypothetical protein AK830_g9444 [Neonectria ditissima]|uniref:Extracellular protein n=1 Tax=Neonectria ditissima TaxID=78410 RepID=A0A0N8H5U3_9HYPO|nr:hypothetical protein AK830_g9444 [Neonectria ditissima]